MHRAHAVAQRARGFRVAPDHEAGHVDQENQRDVERVAQIDEVGLLARALSVDRPAVKHRVVGNDANDLAVHAREHRDDRLAKRRLDLETALAVDDHGNQLAHVVGFAPVLWNDRRKRFVAPFDRVGANRRRGELPHILRHVRQETTDHREAVMLARCHVVDGTCHVDGQRRPAELFLGNLLAERAFDDRGASRKHLAGVLDHDSPVREDRAPRRAACRRAKHCRHDRDFAEQFDRALKAVHARDHRMPAPLDRGDAATCPVDQVNQRNTVLVGHILDEAALAALLAIARPAGAAPYGEILAAKRDCPSIDLGQTHDVRRGRNLDQLVVLVLTLAGELADFLEGAGVHKALHPFAYRQPALRMVLGHCGLAAHCLGLLAAKRQFGELVAPVGGGGFCLVSHRALPATVRRSRVPEPRQSHRLPPPGSPPACRHLRQQAGFPFSSIR